MDSQKIIQVKVGIGIVEVLQLDDQGVMDLYKDPVSGQALVTSSADRRHIYINGTRASLEKFAKDCEGKAVSIDAGPKWYANSCATSAKAVRDMLHKIDQVMRL